MTSRRAPLPIPVPRWLPCVLIAALLSWPCHASPAQHAAARLLPSFALAQNPPDTPPPPGVPETYEPGEEEGIDLLAIPAHDTFESIALADWMLRLAYLVAVLFTTGFAVVLPFVPWLIRVRGTQRSVYFVYSIIVRTYYLIRHMLWTVRWPLLGVFLLLLCVLFVYFMSAGVETMLE